MIPTRAFVAWLGRVARRGRVSALALPRWGVALEVAFVLLLAFVLVAAGVSFLWFLALLAIHLAALGLVLTASRSSSGAAGQHDELDEVLDGVARMREHLVDSHFSTVKAMALALEARDVDTQGHCLRVRCLTRRILDRLRLDPESRKTIEMAALLHDIGKIGIPDAILLKDGPLTTEERKRAMTHVDIGVELLQCVPSFLGTTLLVKHHHEFFDGSGYPDGLRGDQIPLGSRVIAVADAIDAMRSNRPYRPPLSLDRTIVELQGSRGRQLDPTIVDIAVGILRSQAGAGNGNGNGHAAHAPGSAAENREELEPHPAR